MPVEDAKTSEGRSRPVRKVAVAATGGVVVLAGIVLLPLPGPGTVVILGGLAILGSEFPSARRPLDRLRTIARTRRRG